MPVLDQTPYNQHVGNGVTTVFAYGFRLLATTDLDVYLDGVLQASGYTVTGVGDAGGGTVVFAVAPGSGVAVLLQRDIQLQRDTDYQNGGDLLADTLDADFDRLWMAMQGEAERNDRQITLPVGSAVSAALPAPVAARYLRVNAAGTGFEFVDLVSFLSLAVVSGFIATLLDDVDAAAARTTLGLGTAATQNHGTGANNVVRLDGSARLPAVDGSQLTGLPVAPTLPEFLLLSRGIY
jgi:hypothetical protein